ncbi:PHD/FYVE-zinc-finger like domain-containing protein [Bombardia bombarda]|uniref:PHD/FYVE-zinc-finger like domain-containing protein n=1 Tax=Bombardia bombarda TaxID=252184 RepID=A0AA39XL06_9PEZI|nr:PHD/FYVE-zinc-finger like domain-containing protein [Bombardia bombarda]
MSYFNDQNDDIDELDSRKRKRNDTADANADYVDDDSDDYGISSRRHPRQKTLAESGYGTRSERRNTRYSTRASSLIASSEGEHGQSNGNASRSRELRPRADKPSARQHAPQDDDKDELQDSDHDNDPDFFLVQSDIVKTTQTKRRGRKPRGSLGRRSKFVSDDIEFETRRSSRANKNTRTMADNVYGEDDDDIFYVDEDKPVGASKVASMREIFQPPDSVGFKEAHCPLCDTCGMKETPSKGSLVFCQGCSTSHHKICLGGRSVRDQVVTKVGQDSFVMQCRFCVGIYKKKNKRAPSHDVCTGCHKKGPACAPFSQKKTPKQEEKLREENDGVDPITPVAPSLINNDENVLFRCTRCHRGWHYEHLPHPTKAKDPAINDPKNLRKHRREEYQINWLCKDCIDTDNEKVDKLVAWRPTSRDIYTKGQEIQDFGEDDIEYLIKWQNKSYVHCVWMPGPWVFGVVKALMLQAFVKRTYGENMADDIETGEASSDALLQWTTKEAVHDSWITPDIILDVQYIPRTRDEEQKYKHMTRDEKKDYDRDRIYNIIKIYVKFEGLSYEDVAWDDPPPSDSPALWDAYLDAYNEYLNGKHFQNEPWHTMVSRMDQFRVMDFNKEIEVEKQPKGLQRGKLMGYQLEGLNWMLYNFRHERSVILADEMGLGKTVQVVALLASFIQDNPKIWPFLIVVPNSTCPNWRREIKKWAPDLRVVAYYGGKASQSLALNYELFPNDSRDLKAHVVIMSYDSAKDPETRSRFSTTKWAGLVVDEAQALKNDENGLYKALSSLRIQFKLLLTGTPLQNNKRELFNLLQFIDPKNMQAEKLDEEFGEITKDNLPKLHELIRPYFLRRTKAMVLTFLPTMAQIILPVTMTVVQERLCKSIMERNPDLIRSVFARGKLKPNERGSLSNILMQLRKCLCHPFVYSQAVEDRNLSPELTRRNLVEASSKLLLLEVMLPKLKARGHRVLMFSQFLDELTILEDFLIGMDLRYERLDGNQSSLEKQKRIDAFNAPDSKLFAMLLSTRAGGVGINLATADTVIILDPDWNPHQDIQALSRAHRIGQKKKVLCFQLMTVDSAEEKMLQIGRKKMALDHLLIETMDEKEGEVSNDVESVLKHGAAALFGEAEKKEAITYDEAAVDRLLDRSLEEETKVDGDKSAESAFAFARVWAQDKGVLTDEVQVEEPTINVSVWEKILKQREEEARLEKEKERETLGRGGRRRGAANYTNPKFDFEEPQDGAGAESDQMSVDEDFVGGESDGYSSDERDKPTSVNGGANGESSVNGANSRKSQGRGSSDTHQDAQSAQNATLPKVDARKGEGRKNPDQTAPNGTGGSKVPKDAKDRELKGLPKPKGTITPVPLPATATAATTAAAVPRRRGPGKPKIPPNLYLTNQPKPPSHVGHGTNAGLPAATAAGYHASPHSSVPVPAGGWQQRPGGANSLQPPAWPSGPNPRTSTNAGVQPPSRTGPDTPGLGAGMAGASGLLDMSVLIDDTTKACLVCTFIHPTTWNCPEMSQEIQLRLALDRLKTIPGQTAQQVVLKRACLHEMIRRLKLAKMMGG